MNKIIYRASQPTPPFFCRLRKKCLLMAFMAMMIILIPVAIPPLLLVVLGHIASGGLVAASVCQLTVDTDASFLAWIYGKNPEYLPGLINKQLLK